MSNGKRELGKRPVGRTLSDADQKFIARTERAIESGKMISDGDQVRYKRLIRQEAIMRPVAGGRTVSWGEYKKLHGEMQRDLGDTGGRTVSDRDLGPFKKGGSVKKYVRGGGVRKVKNYNY